MMFLNIEGLFRGKDKWKKVNFLRETASEEKPEIIFITESHLNDEIENKEIAIPDYSILAERRARCRLYFVYSSRYYFSILGNFLGGGGCQGTYFYVFKNLKVYLKIVI